MEDTPAVKAAEDSEALSKAALEYHEFPTAGKISVTPTKSLTNQRELSLAYSPGVAAASLAIAADPLTAARYTSRANLVGVITNGTAVLGLGNIGPLAAKPVMEGKGCLFKRFAGIDVFDIELDENDPDRLVDIIAALQPTLGGINLEDIKAPECFYVERKLSERLSIPVFHDDQHGTAIISSAALVNGLALVGKRIDQVKLVCSGAGAAAIACLDLMVGLGLRRENVWVCDSRGVIYEGRETKMEANKARYAQQTKARSLADVMPGADFFLGCSAAGALTQDMVKVMAPNPIILALANPEPEIRPEAAKAVRPDAIVATGRSDYPNQVNNVLCFPYIFRGALDVGATKITASMKLACVQAIADMARSAPDEAVARAYSGETLSFGPEYIIPKPFDPRLLFTIAPAVAKAAMADGVATRPLKDLAAYTEQLESFVLRTRLVMRPVFAQAKSVTRRVAYAEGEDERVLRAVQVVLDEGLAKPVLIGRPAVIAARAERMQLRFKPGVDAAIINPEDDPQYRAAWEGYRRLRARSGVTPDVAKAALRRSNTVIGCMLMHLNSIDALLCGVVGSYDQHLAHVEQTIGKRPGVNTLAALNLLMLPRRNVFVCDTYVNENPTAQQIAEMTLMAAEEIRRFGLTPKVALLSHSNFGSRPSETARKMAQARQLLTTLAPDLEVDGEMHADAALSEEIRHAAMPDSTLRGEANLLVMPNIDAANIAYNLLKMTGSEGVTVGPILMGAAGSVHILTPSATVRRLVNMTALAATHVR